MKYLVIKDIRKRCGSILFRAGMSVELNPLNPKVQNWIKDSYLEPIPTGCEHGKAPIKICDDTSDS